MYQISRGRQAKSLTYDRLLQKFYLINGSNFFMSCQTMLLKADRNFKKKVFLSVNSKTFVVKVRWFFLLQ